MVLRLVSCPLAIVAAALVTACASDPGTPSASDAAARLQDAEPAGRAYAAVGRVGNVDPATDRFQAYCTATLIASDLVLTSTDCLRRLGTAGKEAVFSYHPVERPGTSAARTVRIAKAYSPSSGWGGGGPDVAVLRLATTVGDIAPIPLGRGLIADDEGKVFEIAGVSGAGTSPVHRKVGAMTLTAVEGQPLRKHYPSRADYQTYVDRHHAIYAVADDAEAQADQDDTLLLMSAAYDLKLSSDAHEIYAGLGEGDARPCAGDEGGPLLEKAGTALRVVGVVATRAFTLDEFGCARGATFTGITPDLRQYVDAAVSGAEAWGECDAAHPTDDRWRCDGTVRVKCDAGASFATSYRDDCGARGDVCRLTGQNDSFGPARCD